MSHVHCFRPCVSSPRPQPEGRDERPETGSEDVGWSGIAWDGEAFWAGCPPSEPCSARTRADLHTHTHARAHTPAPLTCLGTGTHSHIRTHAPPAHTFVHSHSCTHTHTFAHMHTHSRAFLPPPGSSATRPTSIPRRWTMPSLVPSKSGVT